VAGVVKQHALNTICSSGRCPNKAECWNNRTATLMIMGDVCTRACRFCATASGRPLPLQADEPQRVAGSIGKMGLRHAVITSVTRDDLPDHGAAHWAATIEAVRAENPNTTVEVLIPDMGGERSRVAVIAAARPHIIGHNVECVERLTPAIRSRASYATSLRTLEHSASMGALTKSGLMAGLGETEGEVLQTLRDLRAVGVQIVTIGQYLQPTSQQSVVSEYVTPEQFESYRLAAQDMGFLYVASAPLVRSSYMAHRALEALGVMLRP